MALMATLLLLAAWYAYVGRVSSAVVTINGERIGSEELLFFISKHRSEAVIHFRGKLEFGEGFWDAEVDGITPKQYIAEQAVNELRRIKSIQLMAQKAGISKKQSFKNLQKSFAEENKTRSQGSNYGMNKFDFEQYYDYYVSKLSLELLNYMSSRDFKGKSAPECEVLFQNIINEETEKITAQINEAAFKKLEVK